ncbi:MAG: hypothetical protein LBV51_01915 [Acholeplasmatales bacterium]|jgi:hypothetical protein|nr:hypothetical protein [Acholeplasmatales bacterium]
MFKKLLFTILLLTLILPFVSCVKEQEQPKDIIETFTTSGFIKINDNKMEGKAYLFMKAEDINDEIFVLPNVHDPSRIFEYGVLLYVGITVERGNIYKPLLTLLVNGRLELLFSFSSDNEDTLDLHGEEFGIIVSKDCIKQKYNTITIKVINESTLEYGDSFIPAAGKEYTIL